MPRCGDCSSSGAATKCTKGTRGRSTQRLWRACAATWTRGGLSDSTERRQRQRRQQQQDLQATTMRCARGRASMRLTLALPASVARSTARGGGGERRPARRERRQRRWRGEEGAFITENVTDALERAAAPRGGRRQARRERWQRRRRGEHAQQRECGRTDARARLSLPMTTRAPKSRSAHVHRVAPMLASSRTATPMRKNCPRSERRRRR